MSLLLVRQAFEMDLKAMTPTLPIEFENQPFTKPAGPYCRAHLLPAAPDNATLGDGMYWEQGLFQVLLCYPLDAGTADVMGRAQMIKERFFRGRGLPRGSLTVVISATPTVAPGFIDGDRYCVAVRIAYHAQIFT